jgi:hypothetical protein
MFSVDAAAVTSMNMRNSCNDLQPEHAAALQIQLRHFPALKHIDLSRNPGLRLLPVSLLHIAAGIETFNCIECSLRLPAQSFFSESEEASCLMQNSRNIQALINGSHNFFDQILDFSGLDLMPSQASEIACYLRFYKNVERLDISRNPTLSRGGAATILSALEGTSPFSFRKALSCACIICDSFFGAGASTSSISTLNLSDTSLVNADATALQQVLCKLRAIEHLDLSLNRELGSEAVAIILQSLSGK